jgi:hypothetical protein
MKRQSSTLLHLFVLLALSVCGVTKPNPSPMSSSATKGECSNE